MQWIGHPVTLTGNKVKLIPLERHHFEALLESGRHERIWEFFSTHCKDIDQLLQHLQGAVLKRATGEQYPFAITDRNSGKFIGYTMFHNISRHHRSLEIGWTWLAPAYWRTGCNRECKLLLLSYCFEQLGARRVQFQTDENNFRSRAALSGIGAVLEGILRNDRVAADGSSHNTAVYSIIEEEWLIVKEIIRKGL